ncbi:methyl-accepting chemotaxis protein [Pontixanthobacter sp. CEM42]|uniref:methyl-accepting chemotaxis protein n=1 Tax=Pontixanthobacter sp. CEM42 TaxID=2792077 RepID=UPI001FD75C58|nr:methyl-accepting chemotaxis protein [Pontixanthobacter sp. CEM42]
MSAMDKIVTEIEDEIAETQDSPPVEHSNAIARLRAWFKNQPIPRKLKAVFGAFLVLLTVTAGVVVFGMVQLYDRTMTRAALSDATIEAADLRSVVGEMRYHAMRYTLSGETAESERMSEALSSAQSGLGGIAAVIADNAPQFTPNVGALEDQLDGYGAAFERVKTSRTQSGASEETTRLAYELAAAGDTFYTQSDALEATLANEIDVMQTTGLDYFFDLVSVVLVLAGMSVAILFFGMRFLARDLIRKGSEIVGGMNELAAGRAEFEIEGAERKDEIGDMIRALEVFKRANGRLIRDAKEREERVKAEQDLLAEREREKEERREQQQKLVRSMADRFERTVGDIVGGVASASSQLKSTAGSMAAAAEQSSNQTNLVVTSMGEASSGVTAAAAASDEFAMSIGEISRQAASSAELARKASESAEQADTTISALSDSAEQVSNVVELIHSIAKRTNLLALNASIEAARGGEAGRGFAVVASEVKELAAQTSRATEDVADQIRAMQSSTTNSVSALRTIGSQIEQLESTAISIASAVDQQSVAGQDLARSIDLAARSSDEVSSSIVGVRETSLATGAAASQVLNSATELEDQAASLRNQVGDFLQKVRNG